MTTKSQIRKMLAARLKSLDHDTLKQESAKVVGNIIRQNFATASQHPSIFLSMPSGEIDTSPLVEILLQEKEKVYIPKVIGPHAGDMIMIPIDSMDTIHNFPKSKWGIPEPPLPEGDISIESFGDIDFVFLPGVAFDTHCRRLGHGRGYYDCFLDKLLHYRESKNLSPPLLVGLALDEQIIDTVPVESHDKILDYVVTPTSVFAKKP